jgi:hypothetical protein
MKDQIVSLKNIMDKKVPFSPTELEQFTHKVTFLLLDLQKLLNTNKTEIHSVHIRNIDDPVTTTIPLSGLFDRGFVSSGLCTSGTIIKEEILEKFNIKLTTPHPEICAIADELCQTYQDAISRTELERARSSLEEMRLRLEQTQSELETIRLKLETAENTIREQEKIISTHALDHAKSTGPKPASMSDYSRVTMPRSFGLFSMTPGHTGRPKAAESMPTGDKAYRYFE